MSLIFFVNGRKVVDEHVDPEDTLLLYLRNKLHLTGSKLGCGEGGCGACTVLVSRYNKFEKRVEHRAVNACLTPICAVDHCHVITVEGIGGSKSKLHAVQERIAQSHGSQCGFCTPGIVMSMYALLRNNPNPTEHEIEDAFDGNLCRCTGYRPILSGFRTFASDGQPQGCCGGGKCAGCSDTQESSIVEHGPAASQFMPYDPSQELIFPPELLLQAESPDRELYISGPRVAWHRPTTLEQLVALKRDHPDAKIPVGNTELGVEVKFKHQLYTVLIDPTHVPELNSITSSDTGIVIGAAVTLHHIEVFCKSLLQTLQPHQTGNVKAIIEMLRWFAGTQIRNVACIGGNVVTASPISDLNPVLVASGSTFVVQSKSGGQKKVPASEFFLGYRKTALAPDEVLVSITVPHTKENEFVQAYKQARRREDDITIVNACMRVQLKQNSSGMVVEDAALAFGGMAPTTKHAIHTSKYLIGKAWNRELFDGVAKSLLEEMHLKTDVPGGMPEFRQSLTVSFFFKFLLTVLRQVDASAVAANEISATERAERPVSKSVQRYEAPLVSTGETDTVGKPVAHLSANKQAAGEAVYTDDIPLQAGELYSAIVWSTQAHAEIKSVDPAAALSMAGVHAFYGAKDVPGANTIGPIALDEECFASEKVTCVGAVVGIIVADTHRIAQEAARKVKIEYKPLPPIVTIEQAIEAKSFYSDKMMGRGNVDDGFAASDHVLEGEMRVGGQEHFYFETNATVAVPKGEDGEMEIFASTQNTTKTQAMVARVLGVPANRIVCRVKRLGGGFGGKESRSIFLSAAVAVAAHKLGRPVRCMLDRDEDMCSSGGRHPFLARYKVGFTNEGKIKALDVTMYSNAGNSLDLSESVMDRALFSMDNCYNIEHVRGRGVVCKTNLPSNTAFRGFGGPQGLIIAESWIEDVARKLNKPSDLIREINFYHEGDETHFGQALDDCQVEAVWHEVKRSGLYVDRRAAVQKFNRENRYKKRGIAIVPTKYGISFTATFLNQAGALVHIYLDGSVLITHGGIEMGQGLHTKVSQVAARALGVPLEQVHVTETGTNTVPNSSPTAASASSDLYGMAVMLACRQLSQRLEPYKAAAPDKTFADWARAAYFDRVSLSATGFYKTPDLSFDWATCKGRPFNYFCYGAACAEVEVDVLTGDHETRRVDICMDVGASLNPAIDIGQVEGAFVQGMGLFTLEEMVYSPTGVTYSRGPGAYKIPGFKDIPVEMNVSLLHNAPNVRAIHSSKAVGEPPLFLGAAVYFAIKDAIAAARLEDHVNGSQVFRLDTPATSERIRMACTDEITHRVPKADPKVTRWNVQV